MAIQLSMADVTTKASQSLRPVELHGGVEQKGISVNLDRVVLGLAGLGALFTAGYVGSHLPKSVAIAHVVAAATPSPSSQAGSQLSPGDVVRDFYLAVNERRFRDAYADFSSAYRTRASLAQFTDGYRTTRNVIVHLDRESGSTVAATIHATDQQSDGSLRERTFRGHWNLLNDKGRWRLLDGAFSTVADSAASSASPVSSSKILSRTPVTGESTSTAGDGSTAATEPVAVPASHENATLPALNKFGTSIKYTCENEAQGLDAVISYTVS